MYFIEFSSHKVRSAFFNKSKILQILQDFHKFSRKPILANRPYFFQGLGDNVFINLILMVIFGIIEVSPALAQEGGAMAIEITSPKEGELITGDEILLNIKYSGESGNHAHIWLDEQNPSEDNAKTLEDPGPFLFRDVKPGDHTIIVELAGDDHKPIDSAQKITLKVKTRSAADVTQEEIAKALSQIKPAV